MNKTPMIKKYILLIFLLVMMPLRTQAQVPQWQIVLADSQLTFTATQNNAPVSGEFKQFTGSLFIDPDNLKDSSIDIVVDINSVSTSYTELKDTLVSNDWFNVKLFPQAEFKSTKIEKTSDNHYQAIGVLRIRDKSEPVTLIFSAKQITPDKTIVTGKAVIKRTLFGVGQGEWAEINTIKDDVIIEFKVVGIKQ